jgi:hypothetical protein
MPGPTLPPKDDQTALAAHKKLPARIEHVLARTKNWQMLRQCRRRANSISHAIRAMAYPWNPRLAHLRVNS